MAQKTLVKLARLTFQSPICMCLRNALRRMDAALDRWSEGMEKRITRGVGRMAALVMPSFRRVAKIVQTVKRRFFAGAVRIFSVLGCMIPRNIALGILTVLSTLLVWRLWWTNPLEWIAGALYEPVLRTALEERGLVAWLRTTHAFAGWLVVLQGITALAAVVWRRRLVLGLLKASAAGAVLLWLLAARLASAIPAALHAAPTDLYTAGMRNRAWTASWWYLAPTAIAAIIYLLAVCQGATRRWYRGTEGATTWADHFLSNLRTHGSDPVFRRAQYRALWIHVFLILVLPFLLFWVRLMESPYEIPKGSGEPVLEMVRIEHIERIPRDRFVLNPDSAISFYVPKIEDSQVFDQVDEMTRHQYEALRISALGEGGGTEGGWPDGMEDARVRFIRLEYDSGDWDHNMGHGYDYNMLLQFRNLTGFNIAPNTESIRINRLLRFPQGRAPPFVYLTGGMRGSLQLSNSEIQVLRRYCLEMGGMILADNAGGRFDSQFRSVLRRAFPELPLVEIANDDIIFRRPYIFPQGAPPLWHHSGMRALGMRYRGRWIVFYHQGELSDAWRDGHSGLSPGIAMQAYRLGVNVINYAFSQYMRLNRPRR